MRGVNKVIIVGTLGADPEVKSFPSGGSVATISVATSEQWIDKQTGQQREQTEWHRIALYNRLGEIAGQYLRKGRQVYIEGSLRTRKYQDQTGQERYITEIRADSMQMLGGTMAGTFPPPIVSGMPPNVDTVDNGMNQYPNQSFIQPQSQNIQQNQFMNNMPQSMASPTSPTQMPSPMMPQVGKTDKDIPF